MTALSVYAPQRALRDYNGSQLSLIKRTVAKDTNADEFDMFVEVCKRVGLDPFRRQIYCMVYNKDKPDKRQCVFITGIDGFRAVAQRNGDYRPDEDEPAFVFDDAARDPETNPTGLVKATVYAYKRDPLGIWHRIAGVAYWQEFAPIEDEWGWDEASHKRKPTGRKKLSGKWLTMPQLMLAKCAESQALRKGWPEDLSGVYAPEEMAKPQLAEMTASEALEHEAQEVRLAIANAGNKVAIQWSVAAPIEFVPNGQLFDRACKWLREQTEAAAVEQWREINRNGLTEFWALHKADALELKREIEARIAALSAPASIPAIHDEPAKEEPEMRQQVPGKFELLRADGKVQEAFDTPDEWCHGLRQAITEPGAQVLGVWEMNEATALVIRDQHPDVLWVTPSGAKHAPYDLIAAKVRQLCGGIAP